jgi:hypothetical protein
LCWRQWTHILKSGHKTTFKYNSTTPHVSFHSHN